MYRGFIVVCQLKGGDGGCGEEWKERWGWGNVKGGGEGCGGKVEGGVEADR